MDNKGYILESRAIQDSEIWSKPPLYFKVWHYLLMNAQFRDNGSLKRGQLFTSINEIRDACSYYVGYRKVTPSYREIHNIIEWLRKPHEGEYEGNNEGNNEGKMIETTKVTHGMLVTICNFNVYQDPNFYEGKNSNATKVTTKVNTTEMRKGEKGQDKKKNDKNVKKEEYISPLTPLVESLPTELQQTVREFIEHREQMKSPMTEQACKKMLTRLNKLAGEDIQKSIDILDQSIINGWKGIFELKDEKKNKPKKTFADLYRETKNDDTGNNENINAAIGLLR